MKTQNADLTPNYSRAFVHGLDMRQKGDSDHSADKGDERGMALAKLLTNVDIANLTASIPRIYHRDFWRGSRAKELAEYGLYELAMLHLDSAINHGVHWPICFCKYCE